MATGKALKQKKMIMRSFLVCACSLGGLTASAKTLAWYKFSEQADGVQATGPIIDSSGEGKDGTVVSVKGTSEGMDATLAPTYRSAFGCRVQDPVSGARWMSGASLDFAAVGAQSSQTGAVVKVANFIGSSAPAFDSVTVEALVCTTGATCNVFAPIVGLLHSETSALAEHWSLLMTADGHVATRFCGRISWGAAGGGFSSGKHVINDGRWHAVALVHDADEVNGENTPTWRVYVDGELDATYTDGTKSESYNANVPLYIGGYSQVAGRVFNGLIDEVRISDVALAPEMLLRVERTKPIDADTLAYISFDRLPGRGSGVVDNVNEVPGGPAFVLSKSTQAQPGDGPIPDYEFVSDRPCETVANGRFAPDANVNGTALRLLTSAKTNGVGIAGRSAPYLKDSFTAEIFFKSEEPFTGGWSAPRALLRCGPAGHFPLWLKLGTRLILLYNSWDADKGGYVARSREVGSNGEFYDGAWRHFAVVYDRPARRMALYVDRMLRCIDEDVDLEPTDYMFMINANRTADSTGYFSGWIDEFRFTKRALAPNEFLCPANDGEESEPETLLRASFENDWKTTSGWGKLADAITVDSVSFASSEKMRLAGDMIWTNQAEGAACMTNRFAVRLDRGYVGFPEFPPYEGKDLTVELFAKLKSWDATANIFRLVYGDNPAYTDAPICALYPVTASGGAPLSSLQVRAAFTTNYVGGSAINTSETGTDWFPLSFAETGRNPCDGRWHHLALVFSAFEDDAGLEKTRTTLYVDGLKGGEMDHCGHLPFRSVHSPRLRLALGSSIGTPRMNAFVDEVRVTARALQPSEFLTATRFRRGLLLVVR